MYFRKFGNASLFKRKGSDVENQDVDVEVKPHGKESVFKIIYKQVLRGENCTKNGKDQRKTNLPLSLYFFIF